jgi:protein-S-isoprenylcysteine O-methyltransferase Ste14
MVSLIPISRSSLLLIAAPIFVGMDIVLVIIQDKFIFDRMFEGYENYRRETPMLLPNKKSFNAFLRSFRQVKSQ